MSEKQDRDRAEASRHAAALRGESIMAKLRRLLVLWVEGKSDSEIAEALGWEKRTVIGYRQVLKLTLGKKARGRWRERARQLSEQVP